MARWQQAQANEDIRKTNCKLHGTGFEARRKLEDKVPAPTAQPIGLGYAMQYAHGLKGRDSLPTIFAPLARGP